MSSFYHFLNLFKVSFLLFLLLLLPHQSNATEDQQQATAIISKLYHSLNQRQKFDMRERLQFISRQFLGKPYLIGALGEGKGARFDQEPRYRTDAFDCDTFVTTVLALALAKTENDFPQCMSRIRYKNGKVDYLSRNHFTSVDWNSDNQKQGYLKDITLLIKNKNNQPIAKIAKTLIDKPSWYAHRSTRDIRINPSDTQEQLKRLIELKYKGSKLAKTLSLLPYLPLTELFNSQGKANEFIFAQIPDAAIVEIVRPNWNLREKIGTNLNVSHLGFVFWKNGIPYFREASSQYNQVIDVSLIDYLHEALNSESIRGINIQIVLPKKPLNNNCIIH